MRVINKLFILGLFVFSLPVMAQPGYEVLKTPVATDSSDGKVEVVEFFWYGCPHCNELAPFMHDWEKSKAKNVEFKLIAAPLNPSWGLHSRAYYAAEALGVVDKFHMAMFDALHKDRKSINDEAALGKFVASLGINEKEFIGALNSFAVETNLRRAMQLARDYRITGVPTIGVAGKYKTSAGIAKGHRNVINVIKQLVAKESK